MTGKRFFAAGAVIVGALTFDVTRIVGRISVLLVAVGVLAGSAGLPVAASGTASRVQARWVIRDLGTLGGRDSAAVGVNARGQVIGESETRSGATHAFVWQNGRMIDLGTLGGSYSSPAAINDRGQIIGFSETKGGRGDGFLWQNGRMTDLGAGTYPYAINRSGLIVGHVNPGGPVRGFLWRNGSIALIGGKYGNLTAINDRGQLIGEDEGGGFTWRSGRITKLGNHVLPEVINDHGQVVFKDYARRPNHGVLWQQGRSTILGATSDDRFGAASSINERGEIVGVCLRKSGAGRPCLWRAGTVYDLGTPFGGNRGRAEASNAHGLIVGRATLGPPSGKSNAFVWQSGVTTRLPTLRPNDWSDAVAISNQDLIVGVSRPNRVTPRHAVLWTLVQGG